MNYYDSLKNYYDNGCVLHPGTPPVWGEAGYKKCIPLCQLLRLKEAGVVDDTKQGQVKLQINQKGSPLF